MVVTSTIQPIAVLPTRGTKEEITAIAITAVAGAPWGPIVPKRAGRISSLPMA